MKTRFYYLNRINVSALGTNPEYDLIKSLFDINRKYLKTDTDELVIKGYSDQLKVICVITKFGKYDKYTVKRFNIDGKTAHLGFFNPNEIWFIKKWIEKTKHLKWNCWQMMLKEMKEYEIDESGEIKFKYMVTVREDADELYRTLVSRADFRIEHLNQWRKMAGNTYEATRIRMACAVITVPPEISKWSDFLIESGYIDKTEKILIKRSKQSKNK